MVTGINNVIILSAFSATKGTKIVLSKAEHWATWYTTFKINARTARIWGIRQLREHRGRV